MYAICKAKWQPRPEVVRLPYKLQVRPPVLTTEYPKPSGMPPTPRYHVGAGEPLAPLIHMASAKGNIPMTGEKRLRAVVVPAYKPTLLQAYGGLPCLGSHVENKPSATEKRREVQVHTRTRSKANNTRNIREQASDEPK